VILRGTTIAAIAAAAGVGIVAAVIMLYLPVSSSVAEGDIAPVQNTTQPAPNNTATSGYKKINVTVNGIPLVADVAITSDQRSKGLAVKDTLAENESMLFVFSKANIYGFWMKNMKFPIDIIWLDTDRYVIHIEHSLEPCGTSSCPSYLPDGNAQYVLETVAGFATKYNVTENTLVEFDPRQLT
jgi:uncharacterized membrane protein (UPF0127 family)